MSFNCVLFQVFFLFTGKASCVAVDESAGLKKQIQKPEINIKNTLENDEII